MVLRSQGWFWDSEITGYDSESSGKQISLDSSGVHAECTESGQNHIALYSVCTQCLVSLSLLGLSVHWTGRFWDLRVRFWELKKAYGISERVVRSHNCMIQRVWLCGYYEILGRLLRSQERPWLPEIPGVILRSQWIKVLSFQDSIPELRNC